MEVIIIINSRKILDHSILKRYNKIVKSSLGVKSNCNWVVFLNFINNELIRINNLLVDDIYELIEKLPFKIQKLNFLDSGFKLNETYSGNNAQNNETNEREISELNLRATQENSDTSAQRNNQDSKTGTNQEINNADLASAQEKLEQCGNKIPKNYKFVLPKVKMFFNGELN